MAKRVESLEITQNKRLTSDIFILELCSKTGLPDIMPGQFAEVKVEGSPDTFLRRPISIHDVDYQNNTISLLIQIAGKGTEALSLLGKGDFLNLIYPLGNSFSIPGSNDRILLVGGGCGIAPLLFLAKNMKRNGLNIDILLGFRNSERIIEYEKYSDLGEVFLTTEDGSKGIKGFVTNHPVLNSREYDLIFCCGPEPMMKAIAKYSREREIECVVSLENLMGCGIGACLCCIVDTVKGKLCTCIDGPVFNIKDLKW